MTRLTELEDRIAADANGGDVGVLVQQLERATATLANRRQADGEDSTRERLHSACTAALRVLETLRARYRGPP